MQNRSEQSESYNGNFSPGKSEDGKRLWETLGGMVFITELGAFFGTEWDDIEIIPELFEEFSEEDNPKKEAKEDLGEGLEEKTDGKQEKEIQEEAGKILKKEKLKEKLTEEKSEISEKEEMPHKKNVTETEAVAQQDKSADEENVTATEVQQERSMPGEPCTPFEILRIFKLQKNKAGRSLLFFQKKLSSAPKPVSFVRIL